MNDPSQPVDSIDPRVMAALREYVQRLDRGEPVDREEFLERDAPTSGQIRTFMPAALTRTPAGPSPARGLPNLTARVL